ncbi:DUF1236 domain-containing protein [Bauldia litoralis]|uniref:SH3 domain-containing protein n=1 Tax=Bauldia litoralis TaxID=665467 RepID=A0A1G6EMP0_9HYPH|nr:DUF1236 domain-containing protein [Bauldia litoralis]SDB58761.1 SH3 domain-containing protein [Bauldia litoralis]
MWKSIALGASGALMITSAAMAQMTATATTELNVRSGPGPQYDIVGLIQSNEAVAINGCLEGSKWCSVNANGVQGWSYSDYLIIGSDNAVVLTERTADLGVPVAMYEGPEAALPGAVGGAVLGAIMGGPVGAVVGGVAGAAVGAAIDPPERVIKYVAGNPMEPVYLQGEAVVGASLPGEVTVTPIPDYEYAYVYVNGTPVLVDPGTREVVYVIR